MAACTLRYKSRTGRRALALWVFAALALVLSGFATAQETPGQIEKRFQPPICPKSRMEPPALTTAERLPLQQAEALTFDLAGVMISGTTIYPASDFLPLYKEYLTKAVSLADIYRLADAITAKYHAEGYPRLRAVVPLQRIRAGIVVIQVVEESQPSPAAPSPEPAHIRRLKSAPPSSFPSAACIG